MYREHCLSLPDAILNLGQDLGEGLLLTLCKSIDDQLIEEIACYESGFGFEESLAALKKVKNGEEWNVKLKPDLHENLIVSQYYGFEGDQKYSGLDASLIRVFAQSVLIEVGSESKQRYMGPTSQLDGLILECLELGQPYLRALGSTALSQLQRISPNTSTTLWWLTALLGSTASEENFKLFDEVGRINKLIKILCDREIDILNKVQYDEGNISSLWYAGFDACYWNRLRNDFSYPNRFSEGIQPIFEVIDRLYHGKCERNP